MTGLIGYGPYSAKKTTSAPATSGISQQKASCRDRRHSNVLLVRAHKFVPLTRQVIASPSASVNNHAVLD
jgi:hypothetical protein